MIIYGVTEQQANLLDKMWKIETLEGIEQWKKTLPREVRHEVNVLMSLLELAYIDEVVESDDDLAISKQMLSKFVGKK